MDLSDGQNFVDAGGDQGYNIFGLLNQVFERGLDLQILAQKPGRNDPTVDLYHFRDIGVNIRLIDWAQVLGAGILHTKIIIVDGVTSYVGSANMDWKSLTQVKEMGVYVKDNKVLADDLLKVFGTYWEAASNNTIPNPWPLDLFTLFNVTHPYNFDDDNSVYIAASPDSFVVPYRTVDIDALLLTISTAQSTICIEVMDYFPGTFYMKPNIYWSTIDSALRNASFNGIKVKLIVSKWAHTKKDAWPYLRSLNQLDNIDVRVFEIPEWNPIIPFTRVNHAKFMVTDNHSFIGTSNWSGDYFIDTAGVSVNWDGDEIRLALQAYFDRDWVSEWVTELK